MFKHFLWGPDDIWIDAMADLKSVESRSHPNINNNSKIFKMELKPGINGVNFKSQGLRLAGDLYTPDNFDPSASYPAIVFAGPFNQVHFLTKSYP